MRPSEDQPSKEERQAAEAEINVPTVESPQKADEEISLVTRILIEAAPLGAVNSVFEEHPDTIITILKNSLNNPPEKSDELLLLPILTTELDSASDMPSLHLRTRLENPEIQDGERQEALTLLVYTALGSYSGDRLYSSYAFNHLVGTVASGGISHERLEDEVNELAGKAGYNDEQKEAFMQLVEERSTAYLHDAKAVLKDLSRGHFLRKGSADEERRLELYKQAEERDEVLDIAQDIVSNPKMLRLARASLVKEIYLDKGTSLSERHRLQERLQTLAEAGSKLMDTDQASFLAEHLISYNAGEWDLCAQLVSVRDVMGNRQTAAILRTAASEGLFQEKALEMMVEVAHHNPDNSIIAATLSDMLKTGEIEESRLLAVAEQILGGKKAAQYFFRRLEENSGVNAAFSSLPIADLDKKEEILYRFYDKYYQAKVTEAFDIMGEYNIQLDPEQEKKITEELAYQLYLNRPSNEEIKQSSSGSKLNDYSPKEYYNVVDRENDRYKLHLANGDKPREGAARLKEVLAQIDSLDAVINEVSLRLPKNQAERLLACKDIILNNEVKEAYRIIHPTEQQEQYRSKPFGSSNRRLDNFSDNKIFMSIILADFPDEVRDNLLPHVLDPEGPTGFSPATLDFTRKHPLEIAPYTIVGSKAPWATELSREVYIALAEDITHEAKEVRNAIKEQIMAEARATLGSGDVIGQEEILINMEVDINSEQIGLIPFSRSELQRAVELGQRLTFHPDKDFSGKVIDGNYIIEKLSNINNPGDSYYDSLLRDARDRQSSPHSRTNQLRVPLSRSGWALSSKLPIQDHDNKYYTNESSVNIFEQTKVLANYLRNEVYAGVEMPQDVEKMVVQAENLVTEPEQTEGDDVNDDRTTSSKLDIVHFLQAEINRVYRPSLVEYLWELYTAHGIRGNKEDFKKAIPGRYVTTNTPTPDGKHLFCLRVRVDSLRDLAEVVIDEQAEESHPKAISFTRYH